MDATDAGNDSPGGSGPAGTPAPGSRRWQRFAQATHAATDGLGAGTKLIAALTAFIVAMGGLLAAFATQTDLLRGGPSPSPVPTPSPTASQSGPATFSTKSGTVMVTSRFDLANDPRSSEQYLMPPGSLAPEGWPNQQSSLFDFAVRSGGIPLGSRSVTLAIRSSEPEPVLITSIRPVVEARNSMVSGYAAINVYGCGGQPLRTATADLDKDPVVTTYTSGEESAAGMKPRRNLLLEVAPDDPEVVSVVGEARAFDVAYRIEIELDVAGRQDTIIVDDAGEPFHVTGADEGTETWVYNPLTGLELAPGMSPYGGC